MAGDTDFIALYQELGLDSGCSLDAFRQAYRKRVAVLHPDRQEQSLRSIRELQRLNALYAAAMDFQRRHGRLPGAVQPASPASAGPPAASAPPARETGEARSRSSLLLMALALVLIGLWIAALLGPDENIADLRAERVAEALPPPPQIQQRGRQAIEAIELGVSAQQVREIHGEPVSGWEQRWEYGPSWIAFHCGVVVDWYSSPLRPLKVASEHPAATTQWSPPKNCKD